jgi:hypothetical protein
MSFVKCGEYDVGILFSTDTDMLPTLEYVASLTGEPGGPTAEASWSGAQRRRPAITTRNLCCHWVGEEDFRQLEDRTVYSKG